jgi:tryptophan-rich sensory protein
MGLGLKIVVCIVAVELLGGLSGWLTASSIGGWYAKLNQPPGTPPNWVFGPVWTLLYAMMGTALALVWHRVPAGPAKSRALAAFGLQFALNLAWTPVFFGLRLPLPGLAVLLLLIAAIVVTIRRFQALDRLAAGLLLPYLLWCGYAAYLNAGIAVLNR